MFVVSMADDRKIFDMERDTLKNLIKEAMKEWLDEKFNETFENVGRQILVKGLSLFIVAVFSLILYTNFWMKK